MAKISYKEQLLDPRWQRKRLEILERDNWSCTLCGDDKITLHIHHEKYGKHAWDVANKYLHTRCAHCHLLEEYYKKIHPDNTDTILKVSKRESFGSYLILYVYRTNRNNMKLLDIFNIDLDKPVDLSLSTIFCEKDMDSFFDFITAIRQKNG